MFLEYKCEPKLLTTYSNTTNLPQTSTRTYLQKYPTTLDNDTYNASHIHETPLETKNKITTYHG